MNREISRLLVALKAAQGVTGISHTLVDKTWTYEMNLSKWLEVNFLLPGSASFVCYNDEVPEEFEKKFGNSASFAHSKGVLVWTDSQLYWLIHSVPKWPYIKVDSHEITDDVSSWWTFLCCCCCVSSCRKAKSQEIFNINIPEIPHGETKYGQSFILLQVSICDNELVDKILEQLLFMNVQLYQRKGISQEKIVSMKKVISSLAKENLSIRVLEITKSIKHYAKSRYDHKDFYESIVELTAVNQCLVESWMRPAMEESNTVHHIQSLNWKDCNDHIFHIKETSDHSKWAISKGGKKKWVLVGDLNRMTSQQKRGGGGLLLENCNNLYKSFDLLQRA